MKKTKSNSSDKLIKQPPFLDLLSKSFPYENPLDPIIEEAWVDITQQDTRGSVGPEGLQGIDGKSIEFLSDTIHYTLYGTQENIDKFLNKEDLNKYIRCLGELNVRIRSIVFKNPLSKFGDSSILNEPIELNKRSLFIFDDISTLKEQSDIYSAIPYNSFCLSLKTSELYVCINIDGTDYPFNKPKKLIKCVDNDINYVIDLQDNDPFSKESLSPYPVINLQLYNYNPSIAFRLINHELILHMNYNDFKEFKSKLNDYTIGYNTLYHLVKECGFSFTQSELEKSIEIYKNILNEVLNEIHDLYSLVMDIPYVKISCEKDLQKVEKNNTNNTKISDNIYMSVELKDYLPEKPKSFIEVAME